MFIKYPKIKQVGSQEVQDIFINPDHHIIVQEKLDGGNLRILINTDGKIIFGSRNRQLTTSNGEDIEASKQFLSCISYLRHVLEDKDLDKYKNHILFGEAMFKHTINYNWEITPKFILFDVYNINTDTFYKHIEVEKIAEDLGLKTPEIIFNGLVKKLPDTITEDIVPISVYYNGKAEGVVFKNQNTFMYAKYVTNQFKEKNSNAFGSSPKYNRIDDTNNADFIFKYCTNARIEKIIFKKLDAGKPLAMTLMGELIKDVYIDIIEEEWREILTSNWKLSFKDIRKILAIRVRSVLESVITNNAYGR